MTELNSYPVEVFVPLGIDYPEPVASAINSYTNARGTWLTAYVDLEEAHAAVVRAEADDARALSEAVTKGTPTPKGKADAARAAIPRAEEQARQTRDAATAAADVLKAALQDNSAELLPLGLAAVRAACEAYDQQAQRAAQSIEAARETLSQAVGTIRLAQPALKAAGVPLPDLLPPDQIRLNTNATMSLRGTLDRIEAGYQTAIEGPKVPDASARQVRRIR